MNDAITGSSSAESPDGRLSCPRCGSFVDVILDPPVEVCRDCARRLLIEPLRGPLTFGMAFTAIGKLWTTIGPLAVAVTLAFELPGFVLFTLAPQLPPTIHLLYGLVTLIGELAVMVLAHEALQGRTIGLGEAFSRGLGRYGAVFAARWNAGIRTLLWLLCLILPGLYKAGAYSISGQIALFEETSGADAVEQSIARTSPQMMLVLAVYATQVVLAAAWILGWGLALLALEETSYVEEVPAWPIDLVIQLGTNLIILTITFAQQVFYEKLTLDARLADAG